MKIKEITSKENTFFKKFLKLKQTKYIIKNNQFLIEGKNLIQEAITNNALIGIIFCYDEIPFQNLIIDRYKITKTLFDLLKTNVTSNGLIGICSIKASTFSFDKFKKILVLDSINNPGNLGTIIRSAKSFNFDALITLNESTFLYADKVIKSSQGAILSLPVFNNIDLKILQKYNIYFFNSTSFNSKEFSKVNFKYPLCFIFGNESQGISKNVSSSLIGDNVYLKMFDFESLNVAIAASIAMYNLLIKEN